jgi:rhamnosyltransferase
LKESVGDFVLFFTQDAVIEQDDYIEQITSNFEDESVAMVCARQKAKTDAAHYERLIRKFNYPMVKRVRTKADIEIMGVKAFYMSDACSAYRRTAYFDLGGFENPILTNEDMLIAARALEKGYKIVYDPSAYVLHSHNFTCKQEFKRNFDVAAFMVMHKDVFAGMKIEGEGMKLVKYVSKGLLIRLHLISFVKFGLICIAKFAGYRKGLCVENMDLDEIRANSGFPGWWK